MLFSRRKKVLKLCFLLFWLTYVNKCDSQLFGMQRNTVLVLGGNGFIGSETVDQFLQNEYTVTCVNRGNWYWDSEKRIKPRVTNVRCDRNQGLTKCTDFMHQMAIQDGPWDIVVDFSGYRPEVVANTLQVLENKMRLYIYISSDSVYEVSKPKTNPGLSTEEDAVRPESLEEQETLNQRDSYGHRKLACEEVIIKDLTEKGIHFIILRLPDVIGPRDTTNRWWFFQMWLQFYEQINKPLLIPPHTSSLATSYVYVKDVATVIQKMVKERQKVINQVFNVAQDGTYTLPALLKGMAGALGIDGIEFAGKGDSFGSFAYPFPSVTRGGVDTSKIKTTLDWTPTPWSTVIQETVEFYKDAFLKFPHERVEIIEGLLSDVVPDENRMAFLNAVKRLAEGTCSLMYLKATVIEVLSYLEQKGQSDQEASTSEKRKVEL